MKHTAYAATMQGLWLSHDDGESWARLLTPTGGFYNEARCWCVEAHPMCPGEVLVGTDQGLYRMNPAEGRFDYIPSPMDSLHILQVARDPNDPDFIVCGTRPAELFISENNGESWVRAPLDAATECWFINTTRVTSIQFDPRDTDVIWATVEIDGVFKSEDRGKSWTLMIHGLADNDAHDLVFYDGELGRDILASTEDSMHRSMDNAVSWLQEPTDVAPFVYYRSLVQVGANSGIVLASVGDKPSGETGMVLRSTDVGKTWQTIALPHPPNSTIWGFGTHQADPDLIYFCTIFGQIFQSKDGGITWAKKRRELGEIRMITWEPQDMDTKQ